MRLFFQILFIFICCNLRAQLGPTGPFDTIPVLVYEVDSVKYAYTYSKEYVTVLGKISKAKMDAIRKERSNMMRFVDNTYDMAIQAAELVKEIRAEKAEMHKNREKRQYIKAQEKKLKEEFTDKIKNMYIGQGKVLVKLLNRETGSTAYDIIKEMKSGINARFWQTLIYFYEGSLKTTYDPDGKDFEMEQYVKQKAALYGRK
jgi:hypothetical protein